MSREMLGGAQLPRCCHRVTWPADGGFNARFLQHRHSVDGTLDVLRENIPVQVKEAKSKFLRYLKWGNGSQDTKQSTAGGIRSSGSL